MCLKLRKKIPKMANTTMKEKVRSFNGQDFGIVHFDLKSYHMSFFWRWRLFDAAIRLVFKLKSEQTVLSESEHIPVCADHKRKLLNQVLNRNCL